MSRFEYDKDIPAEVLPTIQRVVASVEWMVPKWCQTVYVGWNTAPGEGSVYAWCKYQYRRAHIEFRPWFLSESAEVQDIAVKHEMIHAFTGVLADYARASIEMLTSDDDGSRQFALKELGDREESLVQDLAWMIQQKLSAPQIEDCVPSPSAAAAVELDDRLIATLLDLVQRASWHMAAGNYDRSQADLTETLQLLKGER